MAKKKTSLGCLFYTALVLLLIVLFLFQWGKVREVVEGTGFLKTLQGKGAAAAPPTGTAPKTAEPAPSG